MWHWSVEACLDELQKIAESSTERRLRYPLAAGMGIAVGEQVRSHIADSLIDSMSKGKPISKEMMAQLQKNLGVEAVHASKAKLSGPGWALSPEKVRQLDREYQSEARGLFRLSEEEWSKAKKVGIVGPEFNPGVAAHELGHNVVTPKAKSTGISHLVLKRGGLAGTIAGVAMLAPDNETVNALAPLAPIVGGAPQLVDEARASLAGYKGLKPIMSKADLKAARRVMMKGFGTYGIASLLPAAAIGGALLLKRREA